MRRSAVALAAALSVSLLRVPASQPLPIGQAPSAKPATPLDPVSALLDAFNSHSLVALGEGRHGNEQGHAFRLSLIRDPRFAARVNDVVVEFGSSSHQASMDRFIQGEDVAPQDLRSAWQDTTQPHAIWDRQIYEEFFRAVRAVNASLPRERRIRVL
jgi:erythromycin esterase-like protein